MNTHTCDVCFQSGPNHERCACGEYHFTDPCCLGCPCRWFEDQHPHLLVRDGVNRWGNKTDIGDLIIMAKGHRYADRIGEVRERVSIAAGGAGNRWAFRVQLFPVGKAKAREIRCYPASTDPVKIDESRL